jgi:hypothetical protein
MHGEAKTKRAWCVKDRNDNWCAAAYGKAPDTATSVRTVCQHFILLPHGTAFREPTCIECIEAVNRGNPDAR